MNERNELIPREIPQRYGDGRHARVSRSTIRAVKACEAGGMSLTFGLDLILVLSHLLNHYRSR